ncbi:hemerythrin domain-containing protein [Sphingomonas ginkgonis]|uniref:Hemerythrin domain-containing protein n=1 Tax=Sphingomonas ginkgonis TaxID=2315330 RepID=A0A3R9YME0_9SPHN|nr:hemerythrin domain-containing protein [Sphingomonas ginkgonis]RST31062.1 hemerythrin domain-containing protein [Sphingomonas ginkgonis]
MATRNDTRTDDRTSGEDRSRSNRANRSNGRSAFSWGSADTATILGAAAAGAVLGLAANYGRKLIVQGVSGIAGDWDEVLKAEHKMALAIFDKLLATDDSQTFKRGLMIKQLTHALDKHAHEEEMVVYPALREADQAGDADKLEGEHGYVKTYLYELNNMEKGNPEFLTKVRQFRELVAEHAKMEEEQVFPLFKARLTPEQNAKITKLVNIDGLLQA